MRFLPHAHRISVLSPAPVSHIFHNCRPSMPRKQKAALVPTPIKQSHGLFLQASNIARYHSHCSSRRSSPCNSRLFGIYSRKIVRISTYSLTKRLTPIHAKTTYVCSISTHSLTKRLTCAFFCASIFILHFNSQPHEEADNSWWLVDLCSIISTHSLTKRLTGSVIRLDNVDIFQLTASRRGWRHLFRLLDLTYIFNSQPHEEANFNTKRQ